MVPPSAPEIARWFVEALQAEIAELEKIGGNQRHELLHGRFVRRVSAEETIIEFKLASGDIRIPEDASGKLKTQSQEFPVEVVSVHVDLIRLRLQGSSIPDEISRAELVIDEIGLLRRLANVLSDPASHGFTLGDLSCKVFHPEQCTSDRVNIPDAIGNEELGEKRPVIQQALGSKVTFIWGPPGTGKTFVIARLITALIRTGERVLVTSHTKAAVDQALYEATKSGAPLAESTEFLRGEILRIGKVPETSNLPREVQLDHILEQRSKELLEQKA